MEGKTQILQSQEFYEKLYETITKGGIWEIFNLAPQTLHYHKKDNTCT